MSKTIVIYPFADPNSKYTMMDNFLFDHIMPAVKPNAWKILCLIIRKTRGWHKAADQISFSQIKAGTGISSDETVNNALKQLVAKGYILTKKGGQWDATVYAINTKFSTTKIEVENDTTTEIVVGPATEIVVAPTTKIVDTKETSLKKVKDKASSAEADYSRPISLLSLQEIKEKTNKTSLPLGVWSGWLEDEQAERNRAGVMKFLESNIKYIQLRPINEVELQFFEILAVEYEADGGKTPPNKFPSLETKRLFNEAAQFHNGTLESVIHKAIHKRGKGIAKIVDYINSPEWRKGQFDESKTQGSDGGSSASSERARITDSPKYKRMQANGGIDPLALEKSRSNRVSVL